MSVNVGTFDRIARFIIGLALILAPFITTLSLFENTGLKIGTIIVGAVLLLTSMMRFCPLYTIFGIRTCRLD